MKAKIIECIVGNELTVSHGWGGFPIKRILIENIRGYGKDFKNIAVTYYAGDVFVWPNFEMDNSCKEIGEIEVSWFLLDAAFSLYKARKGLLFLNPFPVDVPEYKTEYLAEMPGEE
ncbi:MAG: hypothetical protein WC476_01510 [Phycisphaerae bacterium]